MNKKMKSGSKSAVAVLLVLLLVFSLSGCSGSGAASKPKPVSEPASGTVLSGYAPSDASEITVTVADTGSCVVMLKDTSGRVLLSFYVRSGDTVTVDVPAEMMYVHFAGGTTWYGEDLLFGEDTVYNQDKELTDFTQYTWEYELDPISAAEFEYEDTEDSYDFYVEPETEAPVYVAPEQDNSGYIEEVNGHWESVHLEDNGSSLDVSALIFSETVYNCTQMTVHMEVEMNAGTSCKDWQIWGRCGNSFVKLDRIYLAEGNGYTYHTVYFSSPVTLDAIAITPTVSGGYSWSMGIGVTDVWTEGY